MRLRERLKAGLFRNERAFRSLSRVMRWYSSEARDRVTDLATWIAFYLRRIPAKEWESGPPRSLIVTTTSRCNAACHFCAYPHLQDKQDAIGMEDFCHAIEEFRRVDGRVVKFAPTLGEVFLDPLLFEKIKYVRDRGFHTKLVTNGYMLAVRGNAGRLARCGVDELFVSCSDVVPARDAKTYGFSERAAKAKMEAIAQLSEALDASGLQSRLVILMRPEREIAAVLDDMRGTPMWAHYRSGRLRVNWMHAFDNWSGVIRQEDLQGVQRMRRGARLKLYPCAYLYDWSLLPSGEIRLCGCSAQARLSDDLVVGDVREQGLAAIWDSERRRAVVRRFISGELPKVCRDCTLYTPVKAAGTIEAGR